MEPEVIDNISCYAPALAFDNAGYHPEALTILSSLEKNNFWYRSRNQVLKTIFKRYLAGNAYDVLEVGCGNGTVLRALSEIKNLHLTGADIYLSGVKFAKSQVPNVEFIQIDATNIPFENKFDAIGCFDVIEHIDDDKRVLTELNKALKKNGFLFLTVPQYPWLWSEIDEIDRHKRRYTRNELIEKITTAGFEIKQINCFASAIFPLIILSRVARKKKNVNTDSEKTNEVDYPEIQISPIINSILRLIMYADELFYKLRIKLPFGGSLVVIATKK